MQLTQEQKRFFDEFGFLQLPGLLSDRIESVIADFENVFIEHGGGHNGSGHDGKARSCIPRFVDESEGLSSLLDDPRIAGIAAGLLGENWNYIGSDGNFYVGDTPWHTDGWHAVGKYIKFAFYLDHVTRDTGALRVIPGSHRVDGNGESPFGGMRNPTQNYAMEGRAVPAHALETTPGDVAVFNHNIFHSAWGGNARRRMFTLNLCDHADNQTKIKDLEECVAGGARFWINEPFGAKMLRTASDERMKHLQQVLDHSKHLPALAAKARATMSEPARG